jgi:hypothetical protein
MTAATIAIAAATETESFAIPGFLLLFDSARMEIKDLSQSI